MYTGVIMVPKCHSCLAGYYKLTSSWENVSSGVSDQVRLKLACSAAGASMRLAILVTETQDITLSRQQTTKVLIRLRGCAGWSVPLLFLYDIRHVFSWPGSNKIKQRITPIFCSTIAWQLSGIKCVPDTHVHGQSTLNTSYDVTITADIS